MPLFRQNGDFFGTLCSLDTDPKNLSEKNIETFSLMAKLIAYELEAEEQRSELDEALKLANLTNESRARFMGILGHDLRNPLNTIIMAATLLQGGKLDAEKNVRMADKIVKTSRRMQYLIEDLLDASQTAQGNQILIEKKAGDLRDICQPIVEEFQIAHPNRKIDFYVQETCYGNWDEGRFGQVLSNLLSNALSYGSSHFPIKVNLIGECNSVVLQVNNQGETMSEEVLKNLFTAFWRGAKKVGANDNSSGLGLGLYIVKQIVEAHGGKISVESNREYGTTFTIIFPRLSETEN